MTYFVTFSTYGTHLPGDPRGSADRHDGWLPSRPALVTFAQSLMAETEFRLDGRQDRQAVRDAIVEVCRYRSWRLLALHVRIDHVHGLVQAEGATPGKVMGDWKAYSSRALKIRWPGRQCFWTKSGGARIVRGPVGRLVSYVLDGQGDRMETYDASQPEGPA